MSKPPIITLLTDFGSTDHYVAAMKGVILGICPEARLVDISNEVRAYGIAEAAFVLGQAYSCFPTGTTHVVVVDPGVGSSRRALVLEAGGHRFVGPDNGVLSFPMEREGRFEAREITAERCFRKPVSRTFHGRDIFAPIAGYLAAGVEVSEMGGVVADPVRLDVGPAVEVETGRWEGRVLYVDRYGNLVTNIRARDVGNITETRFELSVGRVNTSWYQGVYTGAETGGIFVIEGSSGYLEVSRNQGDAASEAGVGVGDLVTLHLFNR